MAINALGILLLAAAVPGARLLANRIPFRPQQHRPLVFSLCAAFFLVFCVFFALAIYEGISTGSVHCFGRRCDNNYLVSQQPLGNWLTMLSWYAGGVFLLAIVIGAVRLVVRRGVKE
jgi:hypothetical protein